MECREFQKKIPVFVEHELNRSSEERMKTVIPRDELLGFVNHASNCKTCHDDLEIYYMALVGYDLAKSDASASFDFSGMLKKRLSVIEDNIKKRILLEKSLVFCIWLGRISVYLLLILCFIVFLF